METVLTLWNHPGLIGRKRNATPVNQRHEAIVRNAFGEDLASYFGAQLKDKSRVGAAIDDFTANLAGISAHFEALGRIHGGNKLKRRFDPETASVDRTVELWRTIGPPSSLEALMTKYDMEDKLKATVKAMHLLAARRGYEAHYPLDSEGRGDFSPRHWPTHARKPTTP